MTMMEGLHLLLTTVLLVMGIIHRNGSCALASSFIEQAEERKYFELRQQGIDEVSSTTEFSAAMRDSKLRHRNQFLSLEKEQAVSLLQVLLPEKLPKEYQLNEDIDMSFDHQWVTSPDTLLPFSFSSLFCESPMYSLKVLNNQACQVLCQMEVTPERAQQWRWMIEKYYRVHLTLDGLPVLMRYPDHNYVVRGYPIGWKPQQESTILQPTYMFNHLRFVISYHQDPTSFAGNRITAFEVHVSSRNYEQNTTAESLAAACPKVISDHTEDYFKLPKNIMGSADKKEASFEEQSSALVQKKTNIFFTYEVEWVASDLPWADRWDVYVIGMPDHDIHYISICNSLIIVMFLTCLFSKILIDTLKQDIHYLKNENAAATNTNDNRSSPPEVQPAKEAAAAWCESRNKKDDTAWKLIHQDVFRPPPQNMLLLVWVGTGIQICVTILCTLTMRILQPMNPLKKDDIMPSLIMSYILCGSLVGGWFAGRFAKFFANQGPMSPVGGAAHFLPSMVINKNDEGAWKTIGLAIGMGLPTFFAILLLIQDCIFRSHHAVNVISLSIWMKLLSLSCFINTPLVLLGTYIGYKQVAAFSVPTKTQAIPREIPSSLPLHMKIPMLPSLLVSIFPFGSLVIELCFVMSALWLDQIYYQTGILLMAIIMMILTSGLGSMLWCFFQVSAQDYRWWWMSFWNAFTTALYIFLYGIYFWVYRLEITDAASTCAYLIDMTMMAILLGLCCGSIGFVSCFFFCRTIYGAVKETFIQ